MSGVEPTRLSADAASSGSLAHALRAARRHGPSASDLGPVRAALPVGPAIAPAGLVLKVGAVLGVIGIAALSTGALVRQRPLPVSTAPSSAVVVASAPAAERADPPAEVATHVEGDEDRAEDEPSAQAAEPSAAEPSAAREEASSATPSPRASVAASAGGAEAGPTEAALLLSAKSALETNPERALALTEEHKRRFPNGKLGQEREVIAIAALQKLGRSGDAKAGADRFKEEHPGSIHQPPQGK